MRQFEEKKYLHVQRKKYYYILTYNKNVYHVALMSLVCAKIEMMLLVSYLVSVVMFVKSCSTTIRSWLFTNEFILVKDLTNVWIVEIDSAVHLV